MDARRGRRDPWERSRSAGNGSSSDQPPEYVHPLDMQTGAEPPPWERGEAPPWARPTTNPFEPPQTTRLVPVGPAKPTRRSPDEPDWPDDDQVRTTDDLDDAQAPVFAADTMRGLDFPQPDERASFVGHSIGRPDFAAPQGSRPIPRAPTSLGDQRLRPTPPADLFAPPAEAREPGQAGQSPAAASGTPPPWVSTSVARAVGGSETSSAGQSPSAEVVVRIELVVIDQTGRFEAADGPAAELEASVPQAEATEPEVAEPETAPQAVNRSALARAPGPVRAAVRIVGVLALVGIGLFLVQLGAWLAR